MMIGKAAAVSWWQSAVERKCCIYAKRIREEDVFYISKDPEMIEVRTIYRGIELRYCKIDEVNKIIYAVELYKGKHYYVIYQL